MIRLSGFNLFASLFIGLALLFVAYGTRKDHWIDKPTREIKSCLSPELEDEERETCRFYAAVIDAGSTGTRLHLFEFTHDPTHEHSPFRVENEIFEESKPGLSSYASEPAKAAHSVRGLIEGARRAVPSELWSHTPIAMKATAGLRLLPDDQADSILQEVDYELKQSGLLLDNDSVGILSGTDEGVFGWFTLNYLTNRIHHLRNDVRNTPVALDLGGGSTQITFAPKNPELTFNDETHEQDFGHTLRVFGNEIKLYTHSYLGNGLVAARLGIGQLLEADEKSRTIFTHCFPKDYTLKDWDYGGNEWTVSATPEAGYQSCRKLTRQYVKKTNVRRASEIADREIYVFAYYFDRAEQAGLLRNGDGQRRDWILVEEYAKAAKRACAIPGSELGSEHWRPWQCLDLSYIYTLLHDGYGLADDQKIYPAKKLQRMELSWALGAAYHLLNTYHDKQHSSTYTTSDICDSPPANAPSTNETAANSTYMGQLYEFLSEKTTQLLTVLRLIS